jgi:hypothetical protein
MFKDMVEDYKRVGKCGRICDLKEGIGILNSERKYLNRIIITLESTISTIPKTRLACILPGRQ